MKEQTLFTFGYLQARGDRIISELIAIHTPLVDIRFMPFSQNWRYTQETLRARAGALYIHIRELGNENFQQSRMTQDPATIKICNPEQGIAQLRAILNEHGRAAIFCACASKTTCHRKTVASLAYQQLGIKIVAL